MAQPIPEAERYGTNGTDRAPWLLLMTAAAMFVFPSNMILGPLGASGYVAMVLAILLFMTWVASTLFGDHDPFRFRYPARLGIGALWLASVAAYIAMPGGPATPTGVAAANRWLLSLAGITGIVFVVAETVVTKRAVMGLVRTLVGGATFCAAIAVYQFVTHDNPVMWIQSLMVGMSDNGGVTAFQPRYGLVRVAGTAFNPIELGVVMGLMLPFAIWKALFWRRNRWFSIVQAALIVVAAVFSVSRSMMLCILVTLVLAIPFFPRTVRKWCLVVAPGVVAALFAFVPGLIGTLIGTASAGSEDLSIKTRLNNYPVVEAMVADRPAFGMGPSTYIVTNALRITDNQYLKTAVEMGFVGLIALLAYFLLPALAGLISGAYFTDEGWRALAGCAAGASVAAAITAATFDELSFPMVTVLFAFVAGISGTVWNVARYPSLDSSSSWSADVATQSRDQANQAVTRHEASYTKERT